MIPGSGHALTTSAQAAGAAAPQAHPAHSGTARKPGNPQIRTLGKTKPFSFTIPEGKVNTWKMCSSPAIQLKNHRDPWWHWCGATLGIRDTHWPSGTAPHGTCNPGHSQQPPQGTPPSFCQLQAGPLKLQPETKQNQTQQLR